MDIFEQTAGSAYEAFDKISEASSKSSEEPTDGSCKVSFYGLQEGVIVNDFEDGYIEFYSDYPREPKTRPADTAALWSETDPTEYGSESEHGEEWNIEFDPSLFHDPKPKRPLDLAKPVTDLISEELLKRCDGRVPQQHVRGQSSIRICHQVPTGGLRT